MCGKGGVPSPGANSTASQGSGTGAFTTASAGAQMPSPMITPYYEQFLANSQALAATPWNPNTQKQIAPWSTDQQNASQQMVKTGMDAGNFDPTQVQAIESPYTEDVVNATQDWFNNENKIQGNSLLSKGIAAGNAFGGDRAGVGEAELAGQQQLSQAPVIAGLRQAGYGQALNEYNQLKQFGMQGAQEAMVGANQLPNYQQSVLDAQTENARAASAYPFQLYNWYGSALGGIGPLTGTEQANTATGVSSSTNQAITTPPSPNPLVQGIGLATSIAGLGSSLFGGRGQTGGLVDHMASGGLVDEPRALDPAALEQLRKAMADRHEAWLIDHMSTQGQRAQDIDDSFHPPRPRVGPFRKSGGSVDDEGSESGSDSSNDVTTITNLSSEDGGRPIVVPNDLGQVHPPKYYNPYRITQQQQQQRAQTGQTPAPAPVSTNNNSSSNTGSLLGGIGALAGGVAKLAPLLFEKGGSVRSLADGGESDDTDYENNPEVTDQEGGDFETEDNSMIPLPQPRPSNADSGVAGMTGAGGERRIPGLGGSAPSGPAPRSFGQRWAENPLTQAGIAMLQSRSPNFGVGLGAGLGAAARGQQQQGVRDQLEARRREAQAHLDAKPQMITQGATIQYRMGNKIIDTGIPTQSALAQQSRERISKDRQDAITARGATPSKVEAGKMERAQMMEIRSLRKDELAAAKSAGVDMSTGEATRRAIQTYNTLHPGKELPVPDEPPPKAKPVKPPAEPGIVSRAWNAITGGSPAAPAAPATPAAPAAKLTQDQTLDYARAAIKRNPGRTQEVLDRLIKQGIDPNLVVPDMGAMVAPPMSQ